jgi:hypothetical protein
MILLTQHGRGGKPDELIFANPGSVETVETSTSGECSVVRFNSGRVILAAEDRDEIAEMIEARSDAVKAFEEFVQHWVDAGGYAEKALAADVDRVRNLIR